MPVRRLLIGVRAPHKRRLRDMRARELKRDRSPVGGEAARQREDGVPVALKGKVWRPVRLKSCAACARASAQVGVARLNASITNTSIPSKNRLTDPANLVRTMAPLPKSTPVEERPSSRPFPIYGPYSAARAG